MSAAKKTASAKAPRRRLPRTAATAFAEDRSGKIGANDPGEANAVALCEDAMAKPKARELAERKRLEPLDPLDADDIKSIGETLPEVLLEYQRDLFRALEAFDVVLYEKSRRIGATWGVGAFADLTAASRRSAGGQDVLYIGYNLELAREFIDCCAMWARAFMPAASEVGEFLFDDDVNGDSRKIKAFRIDFASGFSIVALSSKPRSLRGRQGVVIFDEAAFHDELDEMLKAALALLIWGGKLLIISTHDGVDNPFNQIITETRAGKRDASWKVLRTTFAEAVEQGLYRRVCLTRGKTWCADEEAAWVAKIRGGYGDHVGEELDCIPRASGGRYLSRTLLEARAKGGPVLFFELSSTWVDLPEDARIAEIETWCRETLAPALANVSGTSSFVGVDFGRSGDLSCMWPLTIEQDLKRHTPFVLELRNVPFTAQEQILFYLCDHLPSFRGGALDARGNGQFLAEVARQRYGADMIAEVMLSVGWYREHMPRLKSGLEDDTLDLPEDAEVVDDFRQLEVVDGVARPPEKARQTKTRGQRHADDAIACCLAYFASNTIDGGPVELTVESTTSLSALGGVREGFAGHLAAWK